MVTVEPRSQPRRRWLRFVLWMAAGLVIVLAALWIWVAPAALERLLVRTLEAQGIGAPELRLTELKFGSLELKEISLGSEKSLSIESLTASFGLGGLLNGRLERVTIEGVDWELGSGDRLLRPFDAMVPADAADEPPTAVATLPNLPFDRLEIRRAKLRLPRPDALRSLELEATLELRPDRLQAELTVRAVDGQVLVFRNNSSGPVDGVIRGATSISCGAAERPLTLQGISELRLAAGGRRLALDLHRDDESAFELGLGADLLSGSGALALRLETDLEDWRAGSAALRLDRFELAVGERFGMEGLEGTAAIGATPSGDPTEEPPVDELRWRRAEAGEVAVGAGLVRYRLTIDPALEVVVARCALADRGRVEFEGFRLAPGMETIATRVRLDEIELDDGLRLMSGGRVSGDGRLAGVIEAELRIRPELGLDLRQGRFGTAGAGTLRVADDPETEQLVRAYAGQVARATGRASKQVVENRLVETVQEFAYTDLSFEIIPGLTDATTLRVHAAGKGIRVPQELDMNVNFNGFDQLVDLAFAVKFGLDQARERVIEGVQRNPPK